MTLTLCVILMVLVLVWYVWSRQISAVAEIKEPKAVQDTEIAAQPAPEKVSEPPAETVLTEPVAKTEMVVDTPAEPAKCGCGRSSSGLCVGLHLLSDADWAVHADNPNQPVVEAPVVEAPTKKERKPRQPRVKKNTAS